MEDTKEYTFTRNADGTISIKAGWRKTDMSPATSLRRAILLATTWASGSKSGQLDAEDIQNYLDPLMHAESNPKPLGFVNSPNINTALAIIDNDAVPPCTDIEEIAKDTFTYLDAYQKIILFFNGFFENLLESNIPIGEYLKKNFGNQHGTARYEQFYDEV